MRLPEECRYPSAHSREAQAWPPPPERRHPTRIPPQKTLNRPTRQRAALKIQRETLIKPPSIREKRFMESQRIRLLTSKPTLFPILMALAQPTPILWE